MRQLTLKQMSEDDFDEKYRLGYYDYEFTELIDKYLPQASHINDMSGWTDDEYYNLLWDYIKGKIKLEKEKYKYTEDWINPRRKKKEMV